MKKLLYFGILVAGFSLTACKKCQTCTTTVTQDYGGGTPQSSTSSEEYCGKKYDDAPSESNTTQSANGVTQTVVVKCVDN